VGSHAGSDTEFGALSCLMVVDVIPDGTDVIGCLFRERERLSNQPTAPLAQRVVEPLDMTGLAALGAGASRRTSPSERHRARAP
jgi:hypothetical protein